MRPDSDNTLSDDRRRQAEAWYRKGNDYRRQSDWKHAIDCYLEAVSIDPDSPAAEARQMLEDILNFYHKDAYNP